MVIFPFPQFKQYAKSLNILPVYKLGRFQISRFPNQEIYVKINTNVEDQDCIILGSIAPPDEQLISFLFLAHTLKKEKASRITTLLPYLAYSRQDKIKKGESLAISNIGEIFRTSHINNLVTIDIHSPKVESLFPLPIHNISPAKLFAKEIRKLNLKDPAFVSPDEGAIERIKNVMKELNVKAKVAYMKKKRTSSKVTSVLYGDVKNNTIVVDDILDTGGTLLSCCKKLKEAGAKDIYIFITHGLFTGNKWQKLFGFNIKRIYCTDSVPSVYNLKFSNLKILSIHPLLREYAHRVRKIYQEAWKITRKMEKEKKREPLLTEEIA